jgi:hypothetical protein
VQIGPDYTSLVGSSSAAEDWTSCWIDHYQEEILLEALRMINEEYGARILDYNEKELARIRNIDAPMVSASRLNDYDMPSKCDENGGYGFRNFNPDEPTEGVGGTKEYQMFQTTMDEKQAPRIALGTYCTMGLVPPATQVGDVIVRFWKCDAAIIMRPNTSYSTYRRAFMLVGRADVAQLIGKATDSSSSSEFSNWISSSEIKPLFVDLDLSTLQTITAHTSPDSRNLSQVPRMTSAGVKVQGFPELAKPL